MTAIEQWMEDSATGGWEYHGSLEDYKSKLEYMSERDICHERDLSLLTPEAWQAVGKTRGWREKTGNTFEAEHTCWQAYWTEFYGHLATGLTIEEALSALENKNI